MSGEDILERRYPPARARSVRTKDKNVRWLLRHGFKGVKDSYGEINHYRYDIRRPGRKQSMIVVRAVDLPRWGWAAEAFDCRQVLVVQNGNSVCFFKNNGPSSGHHSDVKDSLLEIEGGIERLEKEIETDSAAADKNSKAKEQAK